MHIEISLLARLLRIPLLRVEGVVAIRDVPTSGGRDVGRADAGPGARPTLVLAAPGGRPPPPHVGRDLAAAEAIVAGLDAALVRGAREAEGRPDGTTHERGTSRASPGVRSVPSVEA